MEAAAAQQKLKLVMLKGPREGETLEYGPGSKFKIGRLVRGKNVSIKDDGISSTHLEIVSDTSSGGQWILKDLSSSNGTTLNNSSSSLPPNKPFPLRDGDVIKLGESTSILVRLFVNDNENDSEPVRPGPSSIANKKSVEILENPRRVGTRNARGLDKEREDVVGSIAGAKQQVEGRRKRNATRSRGDDSHQFSQSQLSHRTDTKNEEKQQLVQIEGRRTRAAARARQDDLKQLAQSQVSNRTDTNNLNSGLVVSDKNKEVRVAVKEEIVDDLDEVVVIKENSRRGKSRNARRIDEEQGMQRVDDTQDSHGSPPVALSNRADKYVGDLGIDAQKDDDDVDVGGDKEIEEETENREELNLEEGANMPDLNESSKANEGARESAEEYGKEREMLNLEKKTMGEWFDYLEVHLPKQIIDATEKMIEEMQRNAERVHAYMMEQNKNKTSQIAE